MKMKIPMIDIYDISYIPDERRLVTGAPEEYIWAPEDNQRVADWLDETIEAESLDDAREKAPELPAFLLRTGSLYTTAEAAQFLEVSERYVRELCEKGRLGQKLSREWAITAEELEQYEERRDEKRRAE
jgi:excisionase family DNA binding protein